MMREAFEFSLTINDSLLYLHQIKTKNKINNEEFAIVER